MPCSACTAEGRRNLAYNRRMLWEKDGVKEEKRDGGGEGRGRNREKDGWKKIRLTLRTAVRRERKNRLSSPCISSLCVMAQRGGNTEVGTWYPLRPVPIPSTAITYNNDGLMEPVGDLTLARKREEKTPRGRYEGVYIYTDMEKALYLFFLFLSLSFSLHLTPSLHPSSFFFLFLSHGLAFYRLPTDTLA